MSRQVDLSKPLSDEDRAYLESRGRRWQILNNDRMFANREGSDAAPQRRSEEDEWADEVRELTVDELKTELAARELSTSGNKAELQKRLIEAGPEDDED